MNLTSSKLGLHRPRLARCLALVAGVFLTTLLATRSGRAESIIKQPSNHHDYLVELEPHGILGLYGFYGVGLGVGGRVGFNIVNNGFIPSLNDSVAINVGADFVRYFGCYGGDASCGVSYLFFPVAMQWNFYFTKEWSAFGEPGLAVWHAFFDNDFGLTATSVTPVFNVGGRYHLTDNVTLTARIGWPNITFGASFW